MEGLGLLLFIFFLFTKVFTKKENKENRDIIFFPDIQKKSNNNGKEDNIEIKANNILKEDATYYENRASVDNKNNSQDTKLNDFKLHNIPKYNKLKEAFILSQILDKPKCKKIKYYK